jgi:hypothetical protein
MSGGYYRRAGHGVPDTVQGAHAVIPGDVARTAPGHGLRLSLRMHSRFQLPALPSPPRDFAPDEPSSLTQSSTCPIPVPLKFQIHIAFSRVVTIVLYLQLRPRNLGDLPSAPSAGNSRADFECEDHPPLAMFPFGRAFVARNVKHITGHWGWGVRPFLIAVQGDIQIAACHRKVHI